MSTAVATAPTPAPEPASTGAARSDFPTWLPPMLVKELRQGLRTRGFVGAFVVFQLLMALMMVGTVTSASLGNETARAVTASTVNSFFWTLLTVQLLLVTPVRALGALQSEIDARTLDLLLLTRLSAWRIVVGKWASLVAQSALLLVAMLPYGIVRYFGGSVDLVGDALTCIGLLGGCAVVTAIMLWASGLPKAVRLIVPVIAIFGGQFWRPFTMAFGIRGGPSFAMAGSEGFLLWFDGALMLVFFLVAAVRRIAPAAESHTALSRGLPLLALFPVPILKAVSTSGTATGQLVFAAIFLAVVCMIELASVRLPMAAHWRGWARRGTLGRFVGRLLLPGWPSALLYASLVCVLVVLAAFFLGLPTPAESQRLIWLALLALGALVLPAVVLSISDKAAKAPGAVYGLTLGAMSTFAAISAAMSSMFPVKYTGFESFARVLPVSGFWLSLGRDRLDTAVMVGQAAFVGVVLVVAFMQSRVYWRMLALHEVRDRQSPAA